MKSHKLTRPSADQTRANILKAAKQQFLKHGFNGTTIELISRIAKVHTNLIFHHFLSKKNLWIKVKELILVKCPKADYNQSTAKAFFKSVLDYRFEIYAKNPDLVKLIQWQQLTENEAALIGSKPYSPNDWLPIIQKFQKGGTITKQFSATSIMLFIIFSTHAPFMQKIIPLSLEEQEKYKMMLLTMCEQTFLVNKK